MAELKTVEGQQWNALEKQYSQRKERIPLSHLDKSPSSVDALAAP